MLRKPMGTFLQPESMMMSKDRHSSYFYGVKYSSDDCILYISNTFPEMKPNVWCLGASSHDCRHESNLLHTHYLFIEGLHSVEIRLKSF